MQSKSPVELADQASRKRAIGVAIAAAVFLVIQVVTRPAFNTAPATSHLSPGIMWAVNAAALLLLLLTGGGLLQKSEIRALVNDDVTKAHYKSAVVIGYWISMIIAMGLYAVGADESFSAREAIYLIVTPSVAIALVAFSWLELRAHRDG